MFDEIIIFDLVLFAGENMMGGKDSEKDRGWGLGAMEFLKERLCTDEVYLHFESVDREGQAELVAEATGICNCCYHTVH